MDDLLLEECELIVALEYAKACIESVRDISEESL